MVKKFDVIYAFVEPDWRDRLHGFLIVWLVFNNPWAGERAFGFIEKVQDVLFRKRLEPGAPRYDEHDKEISSDG